MMGSWQVAMKEQDKKEASLYSKMFQAKASAAAPAAEGGDHILAATPVVIADEPSAAVEERTAAETASIPGAAVLPSGAAQPVEATA